MKRHLTILLLGFVLPATTFAQLSDFDLSRYRLPDIKTNRFDVGINFNQDYTNDLIYTSEFDSLRERSSMVNGLVEFVYSQYRNTKNYQGSFSAAISSAPQWEKYSDNERTDKYNRNTSSFSFSSENRFYFNKLFIEIKPVAVLEISKANISNRGTSIINQTQNVNSSIIRAPFGIGYGRIEPVEDLRLAIYILDELERAGIALSEPSDKVVLELASEISRIKKERFFDSRLKKMKELRVVDSFLVANSIIEGNDINYFNILNDQWEYAALPVRESGFRLSTGVNNELGYNVLDRIIENDGVETDNSHQTQYLRNIGAYLKFQYSKPINLSWQADIYSSIEYNRIIEGRKEDLEDVRNDMGLNMLNAEMDVRTQYIPSTRTWFNLGLRGELSRRIHDPEFSTDDDAFYTDRTSSFNAEVYLDVNYYFSPRLRFELSSKMRFRELNDKISFDNGMEDLEHLNRRTYVNTTARFLYSFF